MFAPKTLICGIWHTYIKAVDEYLLSHLRLLIRTSFVNKRIENIGFYVLGSAIK